MRELIREHREHGDLTLAPTPAGIFVWRFEQRRGEPWTLKLIHVLDDLDTALAFARTAMAKAKARVWLQEPGGVIPLAEPRDHRPFPAVKQAVLT